MKETMNKRTQPIWNKQLDQKKKEKRNSGKDWIEKLKEIFFDSFTSDFLHLILIADNEFND